MGRGIGILGGSFNPVHIGHLRLALEAVAAGMEHVELIPAGVPPHKRGRKLLPFAVRRRLVELAVQDIPELSVNPLEGQRNGPSYTVDTLRILQKHRAPAPLYFILGCGDFLTLPQWHAWEELLQCTNFLVAGRDGEGREALRSFLHAECGAWSTEENTWALPGAGRVVQYMEVPRLDVSSSMIREYMQHNRSIRFLVPDGVAQVLAEEAGQWEEASFGLSGD
ncbi:MAG: nicotinate (nicotinamide) nucleotide adenylyltransferase [Thermodesulfobacteriota bacterium]